jgi:hypothetical protein
MILDEASDWELARPQTAYTLNRRAEGSLVVSIHHAYNDASISIHGISLFWFLSQPKNIYDLQ